VQQDEHDHQQAGRDEDDREEEIHGRDPTSRMWIARKGDHSTGMS
jgi:hypothetical protein